MSALQRGSAAVLAVCLGRGGIPKHPFERATLGALGLRWIPAPR